MNPKKHYKQLEFKERYLIQRLEYEKKSIREIARILNRSPSTISRELKKHTFPEDEGYLDWKADETATKRRSQSRKRPRLKKQTIRDHVENKIKLGWSPELIAGRLKQQKSQETISHEAIYQWIYCERPGLTPHLPRKHRNRYCRGYSRKSLNPMIPYRVPLSARSAAANQRSQFGHWESDTVVSRKNPASLVVSVERKSRYLALDAITRRKPSQARRSLVRTLSRYPKHMRRSITYDNGFENLDHWLVNRDLGTKSYFCEPYRSWEKGTVENTIGLIRRYFPKKTDFKYIRKKRLQLVAYQINNRPKKCLKFKTPAEVFWKGVALTR